MNSFLLIAAYFWIRLFFHGFRDGIDLWILLLDFEGTVCFLPVDILLLNLFYICWWNILAAPSFLRCIYHMRLWNVQLCLLPVICMRGYLSFLSEIHRLSPQPSVWRDFVAVLVFDTWCLVPWLLQIGVFLPSPSGEGSAIIIRAFRMVIFFTSTNWSTPCDPEFFCNFVERCN